MLLRLWRLMALFGALLNLAHRSQRVKAPWLQLMHVSLSSTVNNNFDIGLQICFVPRFLQLKWTPVSELFNVLLQHCSFLFEVWSLLLQCRIHGRRWKREVNRQWEMNGWSRKGGHGAAGEGVVKDKHWEWKGEEERRCYDPCQECLRFFFLLETLLFPVLFWKCLTSCLVFLLL